MTNMWRSSILFFLLLSFSAHSTEVPPVEWPKWKVLKKGPYVGYQLGKYNYLELGVELMQKELKLKRPVTHAAQFGFNVNIFNETVGYELGYWRKASRVDLSYGLRAAYMTNFNEGRFALVPNIGYRLSAFHLQTGYYAYFPEPDVNFLANTFFLSLRFTLVNDREVKRTNKKRKN